MIRRSTVIIFLILLLFLGMVYAPRKIISAPLIQGTLHPGNTDKYGTSMLAEYLRERGYQVVIGGPEDLDGDTVLYIALGPDDDYTPEEMRRILEYVRSGGSLLYANEFDKGLLVEPIYITMPPIDISTFTLAKELAEVDFREAYCNICGGRLPLDVSNNIVLIIPTDALVDRDYLSRPLMVDLGDGVTIVESIGVKMSIRRYNSPYIEPPNSTTELWINVTGFPLALDGRSAAVLNALSVGESTVSDGKVYIPTFGTVAYGYFGGGRFAALSDTAPFINHYFSSKRYQRPVVRLLEFLLAGREGGKIVFDVSKMATLNVRVELPHIGTLVVETLTRYFREFETGYSRFFRGLSEWSILVILIASVSLAYQLRRRLRVPDEAGISPGDVAEIEVAIEKDYIPVLESAGRGDIYRYVVSLEKMLVEGLGRDAPGVDRILDRVARLRRRMERRFPPYPTRFARRELRRILEELARLLPA